MPLLCRQDHYLLKPWNHFDRGGKYWQDFVLLPHSRYHLTASLQ